MLIKKNKELNTNNKFELIKSTIEMNNFKRLTGYFCKILDVSRSGYYNYINSVDIRKQRDNQDLFTKNLILKAFNRRGYKKGSRSIKMILENEHNVIYSLKKIQRIMKKYEIICPHRKANPYKKIAKATKEHRTVSNLLERNFKQGTPGLVLLTDITYLPYGEISTFHFNIEFIFIFPSPWQFFGISSGSHETFKSEVTSFGVKFSLFS